MSALRLQIIIEIITMYKFTTQNHKKNPIYAKKLFFSSFTLFCYC